MSAVEKRIETLKKENELILKNTVITHDLKARLIANYVEISHLERAKRYAN